VCADRRYRIGEKNGPIRFEDNHNKIYEFESIPLIIFNHGVNKFNNKLWRRFCSDYEQSGRWVGKDLIRIADDFKDFIENEVKGELRKGKAQSSVAGFVLCGKTSRDRKFKVKEFFWSLDSNKEVRCQAKRHRGGLVKTGIWEKYLKDYINRSEDGKLNTIPYWKKMKIARAEKELERLFTIAVDERKRLGGDEFSDDFDMKCVTARV